MVVAALICFATLLVAWLLAPDGDQAPWERPLEPEVQPLAA